MTIWETFSKRQKRLSRAGKQGVYRYDELPTGLRVQIVQIWREAIGVFHVPQQFQYRPPSPANGLWEFIHKTMAKELGRFVLSEPDRPSVMCEKFLLSADIAGALDIIELSFRVIDRVVRDMPSHETERAEVSQSPDDAIEELNSRFQEHGVGYQYVDGFIVRIDSQFLHAEAVEPALSLLYEARFDGAADEFMKGFEHYRHGRNKEAIAEALKAFESTMKGICAERKWTVPANATAIPLIKIVIEKGLVPKELESGFAGLRSAMESGLPTLANRTSRHGQGAVPVSIPDHFAAYALHLCASNIVFLVQAHKSLK